MKLINTITLFTLLVLSTGMLSSSCSKSADDENNINSDTLSIDTVSKINQGLVGAWYQGEDLTRIGTGWKLENLYVLWTAVTGHGASWSAQWEGYIEAPATGNIIFDSESSNEVIIKIDNSEIIHIGAGNNKNTGAINMTKGKKYHIRVYYLQNEGQNNYFRVSWYWTGQAKQIIPAKYISYTPEQAEYWNYIEPINPETFDFSKLIKVPCDNYFAFFEKGRFAGWPANNGAWCWGNEILVGFELGYYLYNTSGGHSMDPNKPNGTAFARSLDGGKTWKTETNEDFADPLTESPGINFSHPDFAMRISSNKFFISYTRGKTWEGAYPINIQSAGGTIGRLTSRTDYLVVDQNKCLLFLSAETGLVESDYQDRAFCALTTDGGKTFNFLGWMTQDTEKRSVMPSTVRISENHLISVTRRKYEQDAGERPAFIKNWIEADESIDNGKTWTSLGKVADTDLGYQNGNPPAMVRLSDGRLCVAYGYRNFPIGIRMKVSKDNGKTWGNEQVVRTDATSWDMGYPRMVVTADGKIVLMYYYNTSANPEQHIAVSIIDSAKL